MKTIKEQGKVVEAVNTLVEALRTDPDYYYAYQANIAMAFKDEFSRRMGENDTCVGFETLHIIANEAAKNFLNILIRQA